MRTGSRTIMTCGHGQSRLSEYDDHGIRLPYIEVVWAADPSLASPHSYRPRRIPHASTLCNHFILHALSHTATRPLECPSKVNSVVETQKRSLARHPSTSAGKFARCYVPTPAGTAPPPLEISTTLASLASGRCRMMVPCRIPLTEVILCYPHRVRGLEPGGWHFALSCEWSS